MWYLNSIHPLVCRIPFSLDQYVPADWKEIEDWAEGKKMCFTNELFAKTLIKSCYGKRLTAMYAAQPADLVFAFESTNRPLMPKSHNFILPRSSTKMFDGFTSRWITSWLFFKKDSALTVWNCNGHIRIYERFENESFQSFTYGNGNFA